MLALGQLSVIKAAMQRTKNVGGDGAQAFLIREAARLHARGGRPLYQKVPTVGIFFHTVPFR